jgi:hypothetical protein
MLLVCMNGCGQAFRASDSAGDAAADSTEQGTGSTADTSVTTGTGGHAGIGGNRGGSAGDSDVTTGSAGQSGNGGASGATGDAGGNAGVGSGGATGGDAGQGGHAGQAGAGGIPVPVDAGGSVGTTSCASSGDAGELQRVDAGPFCVLSAAVAPTGPLISDFESPSPLGILSLADPNSWNPGSDGSGTISLNAVPGGLSGNAAHLLGANHTIWGGDMDAYFRNGSGFPVDASAYQGIRLYLRGIVGNGLAYVKVQNSDSLAQVACGCSDGSTDPARACYGGYWATVVPTDNWQEIKIPWSCFVATSFGYHAHDHVDPRELMNLAVGVQLTAAPASWDLWVDTVSFY